MILSVIYTAFAATALVFNVRAFHRAMVRYQVYRLVYGETFETLPPKEQAAYLTAQGRVRTEAVRLTAQGFFFAIGISALVGAESDFTAFIVPFGFIAAQVAFALNGWMDDRSATRITTILTPPGAARKEGS